MHQVHSYTELLSVCFALWTFTDEFKKLFGQIFVIVFVLQ